MRALWVGAIKPVTLNEAKGLVETNAGAKHGRGSVGHEYLT